VDDSYEETDWRFYCSFFLIAGGGIRWLDDSSWISCDRRAFGGWRQFSGARPFAIFSIPSSEQSKTKPDRKNFGKIWKRGEKIFAPAPVRGCHGFDAKGKTTEARGTLPEAAPTCPARKHRSFPTAKFITSICVWRCGLSGMPAWSVPHETSDRRPRGRLTMYVRSLVPTDRRQNANLKRKSRAASHYIGSPRMREMSPRNFTRIGRRPPMAKRCPRPAASTPKRFSRILTNEQDRARFKKEQVAFVYGSIWKQRYFEKVGDDYFSSGRANGTIVNKAWKPYFRAEWGGLVGALLSCG